MREPKLREDLRAMKLYVNGDSHAAAAEAVNAHAFAEDDSAYFYLGRAPHPANLAASWSRVLADAVGAVLHNDSESASSNTRILRTARAWLSSNLRWCREIVMLIQWSTWERQEWLIDGKYYQVNASGIDHVPESHQQRYRKWIADLDWTTCRQQQHELIWQFHQELVAHGVRHVFFNGDSDFADIPVAEQHDWKISYIGPYARDLTYSAWLKSNGFSTVSPNSWHFGSDAHAAWARFMLQYGKQHDIWR